MLLEVQMDSQRQTFGMRRFSKRNPNFLAVPVAGWLQSKMAALRTSSLCAAYPHQALKLPDCSAAAALTFLHSSAPPRSKHLSCPCPAVVWLWGSKPKTVGKFKGNPVHSVLQTHWKA